VNIEQVAAELNLSCEYDGIYYDLADRDLSNPSPSTVTGGAL
jgi:hypothetical protein